MKIFTFKAAHSHAVKRGFRTSKRMIHLIAVLTILSAALAVSSVRRGYAADTGTWHGEYFTVADPMSPGATPILVREDATIDFDWGADSPDACHSDRQLQRALERTLTLAAGTYRFIPIPTTACGCMSMARPMIDHFVPQSPTDVAGRCHARGRRSRDRDGVFRGHRRRERAAVLQPLPTDVSARHLERRILRDQNLDAGGALPALVRGDPTIDFDWGAQAARPTTSPPITFRCAGAARSDAQRGQLSLRHLSATMACA